MQTRLRIPTIPLSLYVHFPWCLKKCPYCDFNSYGLSDKKLIYVGMTRASNKIYICVDNPEGLTTLELKKIYNNINEC